MAYSHVWVIMTEPVIYRDSPLGEYLEGTGTHDDDWGVTSDYEIDQETPVEIRKQDFAPPSRIIKRKVDSDGLRPLIIVNENISRTAKFYNLFTASFSAHVPPPETARFQERIRYIICTSQLLSEKVTPSLYPDVEIDEQLDLGVLRKRSLRYWIGTGGCVVVVALLISWTLRSGTDTKESKARNIAALALGILVAVYLYAHTRRRYTRLLRAKTLSLTESLVRNSQAFDTICHQTLQTIQEIELVSRGYRLSSSLPPISRLEQSSTLRHCANLRSTLAATITLATSCVERTCYTLFPFSTPSLLKQMHQVYNIDNTLPTPIPEIPSLGDLKGNFLLFHEKRRHLLCLLLSIHVEPYSAAWSTWRTVVRELQSLTSLLNNFTRELQRSLDDDQVFELPSSISTRDHSRGLTSLSTNLKTLSAKMSLLKHDITSSVKSIPESSRQEVFRTYDSIGQDLHTLFSDWQSGREDLSRLLDPSDLETEDRRNSFEKGSPLETESFADSGIGESITESGSTMRKRDSCGDWGIAIPSPVMSSELDEIVEEESVVEGIAKGRVFGGGGSRQERIERMKKDREEREERKRVAEERGRWVGELKDVLGKRVGK